MKTTTFKGFLNFSWFSNYEPSYFGLIRILIWTILFIYLAGLLVGSPSHILNYSDYFKSDKLIGMNTILRDKRWVRRDLDLFDENSLSIAWLGGSSLHIKDGSRRDESFLPFQAASKLNERVDETVKTYMYSISAGRLLDTHAMVQDALLKKPDVVVLTINPFWIYNSSAVFYKETVFNRGAEIWWNKYDWPLQVLVVDPASHVQRFFSDILPMAFDSKQFFSKANSNISKSIGFGLKPINVIKSRKPVRKGEIVLKQPLQFWLLFNEFNGDSSLLFKNGNVDAGAWQVASIAKANTSKSSLPDKLLIRTLDKLKKSGIKTLVYVAPLSQNLPEGKGMSGYKRVIRRTKELQRRYEDKNLKFVVNIPNDVLSTLEHKDFLHLSSVGNFPSFLSDNIAELLEKK